jgi:glycosyltransferase involved in cell wall biosynthesis
MSQNGKYKICLIGECLSGGGAEKAMALLSGYFSEKGIEVHTVIVLDSVVYPFSGELLNLGRMKNKSNGIINKFSRFMALRKYLQQNHFDYIIDFRVRVSYMQEFMISRLLYNVPTIYTVHSAMTYLYFPEKKWQARSVYDSAFAIVTVSDAVKRIISEKYELTNVDVIHNPVDIAEIAEHSEAYKPIETEYILAAGRMKDNVKQFDRLIETYAKSGLPAKNISLVLLGDGQRRSELEKLAADLGVKDLVVFKGFVENPFPYMKNALFFVLSSKKEGLPTVILESLACGTPVVSFDCVSGPSEMISDGQNGLLVENQNFDALRNAIDRMASDPELLAKCRTNAKASVTPFSLENIGRQWLDFLKIDVS